MTGFTYGWYLCLVATASFVVSGTLKPRSENPNPWQLYVAGIFAILTAVFFVISVEVK